MAALKLVESNPTRKEVGNMGNIIRFVFTSMCHSCTLEFFYQDQQMTYFPLAIHWKTQLNTRLYCRFETYIHIYIYTYIHTYMVHDAYNGFTWHGKLSFSAFQKTKNGCSLKVMSYTQAAIVSQNFLCKNSILGLLYNFERKRKEVQETGGWCNEYISPS